MLKNESVEDTIFELIPYMSPISPVFNFLKSVKLIIQSNTLKKWSSLLILNDSTSKFYYEAIPYVKPCKKSNRVVTYIWWEGLGFGSIRRVIFSALFNNSAFWIRQSDQAQKLQQRLDLKQQQLYPFMSRNLNGRYTLFKQVQKERSF